MRDILLLLVRFFIVLTILFMLGSVMLSSYRKSEDGCIKKPYKIQKYLVGDLFCEEK